MISLKLMLVAMTIFGLAMSAEPEISVSIDSIEKDYQIKGRVIGLTPEGRKGNRVVVYVKTDRWYLHPYTEGGDGKSWAAIKPDFSWSIETKRRQYPSNAIAALVIANDTVVPDSTENLKDIPIAAIQIKELVNTADFDKV
jgi:hypothetical protein